MPPPLSPRRAPLSRRNLAVLSHAKYVPTLTAAAAYTLRLRWVKRPGDLDLWPFDLESGVRVTWAISVPILVFLGLSVLDLGPMYATDRRQTKASLMPRLWGHNNTAGRYQWVEWWSLRMTSSTDHRSLTELTADWRTTSWRPSRRLAHWLAVLKKMSCFD